MSLALELRSLLRSGIHCIGEVGILTETNGFTYVLCHYLDVDLCTEPAFGGLDYKIGPSTARDISLYSESGEYRFAKAMINLRRGWAIALETEEELRMALDLIYPAGVALEIARRKGTLQVENLRDKLNRQTGMYRFARSVSNDGAQALVKKVCGPAHNCARRILWRIDANTPLEDNEASQYNGIPSGMPESETIPLLCREACNHFVAECRKAAKAEYEAKQA